MDSKTKKTLIVIIKYVLLSLFGLLMVYPLAWLVAASFKDNAEVFSDMANLFPSNPQFDTYIKGWQGIGQFTFGTFFANSFLLTVPVTVFTAISSMFVGFGFARSRFKGSRFLFGLVISTMLLPDVVILLPRYIMFSKFGWVNSYMPFIIPALFASNSFFVFLAVQFIRGIPTDLDEAAVVDGCGKFRIWFKIILPLSKPTIFSICVFQFMWQWNDYLNSLIYINSPSRYTIQLGLRLSMDAGSAMVRWNELLAMTVLSVIPVIILFFAAQKYFVEGISTTGLKG